MIKKFKNGNINLSIKEDLKNGYYNINHKVDNFIYNEMFMEDLYIETINGHLCIFDANKFNFYSFDFNSINAFLNELLKGYTIKLYKLDKEVAKDLLQDLENDY